VAETLTLGGVTLALPLSGRALVRDATGRVVAHVDPDASFADEAPIANAVKALPDLLLAAEAVVAAYEEGRRIDVNLVSGLAAAVARARGAK